jgi:hypothetical protein
MDAAEFNSKYPVGTFCKYYPITDGDDFIETATRSEAWELGHGEAVVKVEGRSGGVCISNLVLNAQ